MTLASLEYMPYSLICQCVDLPLTYRLRSAALDLLRCALFGVLLGTSVAAHADKQVSLWPTIPFIRGQDLCQFQDAYGQKRSELARDMSNQIKSFLERGAEAQDAVGILRSIDQLIDKNRAMVNAGQGMDVTLEASLKASIDEIYRQINPKQINLVFFNPGPLLELLRDLRDRRRQGSLDLKQLSRISGFAWGSYSYGAGCSGDIVATVHVETSNGDSVSFYAQGRPDWVMSAIAGKMFSHYQRTRFPSVVDMKGRSVTLVGAPGSPIGSAPTTKIAQKSCEALGARLPTHGEYEFLSMLGDWNGGVVLGHRVWAMADEHVLAPDLRNPSPVRHPDEVNADELGYYCVR